MSSIVTDSLPARRLVVQDRHLQLVGRERQPGDDRVHPVVEQGRARFVPADVDALYVGLGVTAAEFAGRRGDDQAGRVADDDATGRGGCPGGGRGFGRRSQHCLRTRQEHLAGLGEPAALRGPVQQPRTQLLLEATNLAAQRRLGDVQFLGRTTEVLLLGDDGEVPHQAQIEVSGHDPSICR
jgi:hypothetical protein